MNAECPECSAEVSLGPGFVLNEILQCPECGVELELTSLDPVVVSVAPEEDEDWGE